MMCQWVQHIPRLPQHILQILRILHTLHILHIHHLLHQVQQSINNKEQLLNNKHLQVEQQQFLVCVAASNYSVVFCEINDPSLIIIFLQSVTQLFRFNQEYFSGSLIFFEQISYEMVYFFLLQSTGILRIQLIFTMEHISFVYHSFIFYNNFKLLIYQLGSQHHFQSHKYNQDSNKNLESKFQLTYSRIIVTFNYFWRTTRTIKNSHPLDHHKSFWYYEALYFQSLQQVSKFQNYLLSVFIITISFQRIFAQQNCNHKIMIRKTALQTSSHYKKRLRLNTKSTTNPSSPKRNLNASENIDPIKRRTQQQKQISTSQAKTLFSHSKAKRKTLKARGSRLLSITRKSLRKNSHAKETEKKNIIKIIEDKIQGMRYRKMSQEYLDKLDCEQKIVKHTHQRKVSFQDLTSVRVFDKADKVIEYQEQYDEDLDKKQF